MNKVETKLSSIESALYSPEQLFWREAAFNFASKISLQDVIKSDKENIFRRDLFELACKQGFGSLPFEKGYGGSGGDYVSFCLVNEELAKQSTPIMSSLGVHVLCQEPIYKFGTEEQKQKYLPASSRGELLAAFCLTEPQAGSDTASISTKAKLKGNEYILNGTKVFITSGGAADYYIVMAKLEESEVDYDDPHHDAKSITAFIVERNFPGLEIGQKFDLMGMRGYATCEIVFNNCRVPKQNLLGQHGQGRKVALSSLAKGRVTIAAQCVGWAQASLEHIVKYGKSQTNLTNDIAYIAGDIDIKIRAARALTIAAAEAIDSGQTDVVLASCAKVEASDIAVYASSQAMSIIGAEAISNEPLLERIYRDAKAGPIYEGTNQIQRLLIARHLLK